MAEMKKEPHTRAIVAYKYICAFRHDFHLPPSSEICPQLGEMKLPDDGYSDGRIAGRVDRNPGRGFFFCWKMDVLGRLTVVDGGCRASGM